MLESANPSNEPAGAPSRKAAASAWTRRMRRASARGVPRKLAEQERPRVGIPAVGVARRSRAPDASAARSRIEREGRAGTAGRRARLEGGSGEDQIHRGAESARVQVAAPERGLLAGSVQVEKVDERATGSSRRPPPERAERRGCAPRFPWTRAAPASRRAAYSTWTGIEVDRDDVAFPRQLEGRATRRSDAEDSRAGGEGAALDRAVLVHAPEEQPARSAPRVEPARSARPSRRSAVIAIRARRRRPRRGPGRRNS